MPTYTTILGSLPTVGMLTCYGRPAPLSSAEDIKHSASSSGFNMRANKES